MNLNLKKPLVFFDLETTGVNVGHDHIVEICLHKVNPDQTTETRVYVRYAVIQQAFVIGILRVNREQRPFACGP